MRTRFIVTCLLMIAAACAAAVYYWPALPEVVPIHWNHKGEADGYGPRAALLLLGPGLMLVAMLVALVLPSLSPRRFDERAFESTYYYNVGIVVAMLAYVYGLALLSATGVDIPIQRAVPAGVFVMLILSGNPMGKVRRNFSIGVRTRWALASERVWYATHRLAARLMVGSGLLGLCAVFAGAPVWLLLVLVIAWAPVAALFSLMRYKPLERDGLLEPR